MSERTLDEIVTDSKESIIQDIGDRIIGSILKHNSDIEDEMVCVDDMLYERVYETADSAVPVYDSDIMSLAASELPKICAAYDRSRSENGDDSIGASDRNFNSLLAIGIYHYIEQSLLDDSEIIILSIKDYVLNGLKEQYNPDELNSNEFILDLIRVNERGWPFAIASENVRDNPIVALEAIQFADWAIQYSSNRLYNLCQQTDPESALSSEILKTKLEEELTSDTSMKRSLKI